MKDPVCGMEVGEHSGECADVQGKHFCFCSEDCKQEFQANPQKYVGQKGGWAESGSKSKSKGK